MTDGVGDRLTTLARTGLLLFGAVLGACTPGVTSTAVVSHPGQTLGEAFPLFEELRVEAYWVDENCRYIAYGRGAFSLDPSSLLCAVDGFSRPEPMDPQTDTDIRRIETMTNGLGFPLTYAIVRFDPQGKIAADSFFKSDACAWYMYDPGWKELPEQVDDIDPVAVALDQDWYVLLGC